MHGSHASPKSARAVHIQVKHNRRHVCPVLAFYLTLFSSSHHAQPRSFYYSSSLSSLRIITTKENTETMPLQDTGKEFSSEPQHEQATSNSKEQEQYVTGWRLHIITMVYVV
jgi:hypothetical protein